MEEMILESIIENPQINIELLEKEVNLLNNITLKMFENMQNDIKNLMLFLVVIITIIISSMFLKLVFNNA